MDGHFSCFYSYGRLFRLIVAMQGLRYLLFWYLSFFVCPSPMLHHQYCLLQVEGDSSEDELHVPFLESV